jgi:mannan endo-1,4-beta-mannosidase
MQRRLTALLCLVGLLLNACPEPGRADTGSVFAVSGNRILKNGTEFVIHGINVNGPGWQWDHKTAPDVDSIARVWKFNLIRVNCSLKPRPGGKEANDLDEITRAFTARGIVVLLDPHDHVGGYYQNPPVPAGSPSLADLIAWQKQMAARYKTNPYVWFEVMGGPGPREEKTGDRWHETHETVIKAIRQEAGANNIIVCEGRNEGTEEIRSSTEPVPDAASAILTYGPELSRLYPNLLYAFHVDGSWSPGGTDKLNDFMERVHARSLPLFVSEYGTIGWPDTTPATEAMLAVCKTRRVGRCAWHWSPEGARLGATDEKSGGWQVGTPDGSKPADLSWLGDRVWDDNYGLTPLHGPLLDRLTWTASAFAIPTKDGGHYNKPDCAFSPWSLPDEYWTSDAQQEPGQWFQVDMGAKQKFSRLMLDPRSQAGDYPRGYEIYVSNDGMEWGKPIAQGKNEQSVLRVSFPTQNARYLKIVQTGKTWHHWTIANLEVYAPLGTGAGVLSPKPALRPATKPVALNTAPWLPTSQPKSWNAKVPLLPLRNADEASSTGKSQEPGHYYQVDMREPQRFSKIVLDCGPHWTDYPRGYDVYVSNDGTEWGKPIAAGRGAPLTTITFPMQTARFFKIVLTRYGRNWWATGAIRVYAEEANTSVPLAARQTKP